jgi:hypothetical protein
MNVRLNRAHRTFYNQFDTHGRSQMVYHVAAIDQLRQFWLIGNRIYRVMKVPVVDQMLHVVHAARRQIIDNINRSSLPYQSVRQMGTYEAGSSSN